MFQFKTNHNIVYTKDKLMKAKMSTRNKCYLCKLSTHTLQHILVDCCFVQSCWRSFCTWWFIMTRVNLNLCWLSILYGYFYPCKFKTITNFALLVAKYLSYRCFLNEESLDFELYKLLLRVKVLTEQLIASFLARSDSVALLSPFLVFLLFSVLKLITYLFIYYYCCYYF